MSESIAIFASNRWRDLGNCRPSLLFCTNFNGKYRAFLRNYKTFSSFSRNKFFLKCSMESFGVKERLLKYLAYKNIPVSSFEKTCGLSNGYVNSIRTSIQPDRLKEIAIKFPDLNISWLLIGETNGENMERGWISDADKNLLLDENCTIPLIPVDAVAGFGAMTYEDQAISDYYNVREFRGSDFLIRVKGDSMYPKFTTGDVVACKLVKERLFFQWGRIYAINTLSQGVMIKRVQPSEKEGCIKCVSENERYAPFDVPISDIVAIALVNGSITLE